MIPLYKPPFSRELVDAVSACLESGWWGYGRACRDLEDTFVEKFGGWALATSSCTSALYTAARLLKESYRDEVIVPAITFLSTAMAFREAGYRVRVADVDPESLMLNAASVEPLISKKTRAIVAVHLYGQRANLRDLVTLCTAKGIVLVEDRAHRVGFRDVPVGAMACFSFNVVKELPAGEGGLLWSGIEDWEVRARTLTNAGLLVDTLTRSSALRHLDYGFSSESGLKLRLNDLLATLVTSSLPSLEVRRCLRRAVFVRYNDRLKDLFPMVRPRAISQDDSFLMYVVRLSGVDRDRLRDHMQALGVATSVHYPPVYLHPALVDDRGTCPVAAAAAEQVLSLPCFPDLSPEEQEHVIHSFRDALQCQMEAP